MAMQAALSFRPADFCIFRTSLLPFDVLTDWASGVSAPSAPETSSLVTAVAKDRKALVGRLRALASRADVREALFIASRSTYDDLCRWLETTDRDDPKLELTLARYIQRMAGRPTPFGLFAGCSTAQVGSTTNLAVGEASAYRRHSRLDNDYLFALTHALGANEEFRRVARYRPNSSLYWLAGRWRYVRTIIAGTSRFDSLVAIDGDDFLSATVSRAEAGARIEELVEHILTIDTDGDIIRDEAASYVRNLIDGQVLVSDLYPIVTGSEALADVIAQLRRASSPYLDSVASVLEEVERHLTELDRLPLGVGVERYKLIQERLETLGVRPEPSRLFQVDVVKPAPDASCGAAIIEEMGRGAQVLQRIGPAQIGEHWQRFKDAFKARYEAREVPLIEVLDDESGIGFDRPAAVDSAPLIKGLPFPATAGASSAAWTSRDAFLFSKLEATRADGGHVLALSDEDLERLKNAEQARLPEAFAVMAVVASPGGDRSDGDHLHVLIRHVSGPSGANIMGRFCHADGTLHAAVVRHVQLEESCHPDAIFAEIVHLPNGRLGNILARPVLRQYEITYLGRSGAAADRQIPVSDLLVSVQDDRVVLRLARLGREVIPRMTNMHNYHRGHPIYQFLCSLQTQSTVPLLAWNWGALQSLPFLPRVTYGRVVLTRARWQLGAARIHEFTKGTLHERFAAVQRWRRQYDVPRFLVLADADNELPVDLDNVVSLEAMLHVIKKRDSFILLEMFPAPNAIASHGPDGRFVHEIIVPFVNPPPIALARPSPVRSKLSLPSRRAFVPGSEWLYLKWYAGRSTVDTLLGDVVPDLVSRQMTSGATSRWFFVRYGDPDWHLRLRFRGDPDRLRRETLADVANATSDAFGDGRGWKMQLDTYDREIERYGGDAGIELSEEIFWRDSEAALEILQLFPGDVGMDARWRLCARAWDLFLDDIGLDVAAKHRFATFARDSYGRQLGASKHLDRALGDRFRRERKTLEALFDDGQEANHPFANALAALRRRSEALGPLVHALRAHEKAGRLSVPVESLGASYLHMTANRLLRSAHRPQEYVLYDFLERLYTSRIARARGRGQRRAAAAV